MQELLKRLRALRQRVERGEAKVKRVCIAGRVHIVGEDGRFVSNLKEKWEIK